MTEKTLQNALYYFRNKQKHQYIVPNAVMNWGEVDLLTVTKSGLIVEHEIKISRSDFLRDARKTLKHFSLAGDATIPLEGAARRSGRSCPNYFFYVVPTSLLKVVEVPIYAGLIYVSRGGFCEVVKNAPRLHTEKPTVATLAKLASKLQARFWAMRLAKAAPASATDIS